MDYKYLSVEETGIEIEYTERYISTFIGAKGSCGEPEEPDEDYIKYTVENVSICGIKIRTNLEKDEYIDLGDLENDIYDEVDTILRKYLQ